MYIHVTLDRFIVLAHLLPSLNRFRTWTHTSEISDHYPVYLEWNVMPSSNLYHFKFNRTLLQDKDFPLVVNTSWDLEYSPPALESMSVLNLELKRLNSAVKNWEKNSYSLGIKRQQTFTWRSILSLLHDPLAYSLTVKPINYHYLEAKRKASWLTRF